MALIEALLPEFDQEMKNTRRSLERIPEDKLAWKPHEKSGTMGWLAGHIATIPEWVVDTIKRDSVDMAPKGVRVPPPQPPKSRQELLDTFDKNVSAARAALAGTSDDHLHQSWSLLMNEKSVITMPRAECIRIWVMNHMIHHRAQLGVYLRLNNVPLPAIYGPSADEGTL